MSIWFFAIILTLIQVLMGCGKNVYKSSEKKDPAQDATVYLENNQPQKAIDLLTDALANDPTNTKYMSILSMAYAERAGVDPITLGQKAAATSTTSSSSATAMTALFPVLPSATDANIADVDMAVSLLNKIPAASIIPADTFKMGIFLMASTALHVKKLDTNGDGILEPSELLSMSTTDAGAILGNLAGAVAAFAAGNGNINTSSAAAQAQIASIQTAINNSPGATPQQKLQNYLATQGQ